MKAQIFEKVGKPLEIREIPLPEPAEGEVRIRVHACGVCRTDLHIIKGELSNPKLPLILGHQIVGEIEKKGDQVTSLRVGERVGVPWLARSCGECSFCQSGRENLCDHALYTGFTRDGGFADYHIADARYVLPLPKELSDLDIAPLLCPGLIGYRALTKAGAFEKIGFFGFGASAHLLIQIVRDQEKEVYAFTRHGDTKTQEFAKEIGAQWAGSSKESPPYLLDAAIIFASDGHLVPRALKSVKKGGIVVTAGIHMSDIPSFPYSLLWEEREIRSVANLTRKDGMEFFKLVPKLSIQSTVARYPFEEVNQALEDLDEGRFVGAAVIDMINRVTKEA